jgi:hypothetical protein
MSSIQQLEYGYPSMSSQISADRYMSRIREIVEEELHPAFQAFQQAESEMLYTQSKRNYASQQYEEFTKGQQESEEKIAKTYVELEEIRNDLKKIEEEYRRHEEESEDVKHSPLIDSNVRFLEGHIQAISDQSLPPQYTVEYARDPITCPICPKYEEKLEGLATRLAKKVAPGKAYEAKYRAWEADVLSNHAKRNEEEENKQVAEIEHDDSRVKFIAKKKKLQTLLNEQIQGLSSREAFALGKHLCSQVQETHWTTERKAWTTEIKAIVLKMIYEAFPHSPLDPEEIKKAKLKLDNLIQEAKLIVKRAIHECKLESSFEKRQGAEDKLRELTDIQKRTAENYKRLKADSALSNAISKVVQKNIAHSLGKLRRDFLAHQKRCRPVPPNRRSESQGPVPADTTSLQRIFTAPLFKYVASLSQIHSIPPETEMVEPPRGGKCTIYQDYLQLQRSTPIETCTYCTQTYHNVVLLAQELCRLHCNAKRLGDVEGRLLKKAAKTERLTAAIEKKGKKVEGYRKRFATAEATFYRQVESLTRLFETEVEKWERADLLTEEEARGYRSTLHEAIASTIEVRALPRPLKTELTENLPWIERKEVTTEGNKVEREQIGRDRNSIGTTLLELLTLFWSVIWWPIFKLWELVQWCWSRDQEIQEKMYLPLPFPMYQRPIDSTTQVAQLSKPHTPDQLEIEELEDQWNNLQAKIMQHESNQRSLQSKSSRYRELHLEESKKSVTQLIRKQSEIKHRIISLEKEEQIRSEEAAALEKAKNKRKEKGPALAVPIQKTT